MDPRSFKISVRLNHREHDHLKKQSQLSGLSMEALIRFLIMGTNVKPIPPDQLGGVLRHLAAIGNNINQIARVANGTGHIGKDDIDAIKSMQAQIWRQVKAF